MKAAVIKACLAAGIAGIGSVVFYDDSMSNMVNLGFMRLPSPVAVGLAVGGSAVATDIAHAYILPHIPGNAKFANIESMALGIAVSGLGTIGVIRFLSGGGGFDWESFLLGAGSYVAADYLDSKLFGSVMAF